MKQSYINSKQDKPQPAKQTRKPKALKPAWPPEMTNVNQWLVWKGKKSPVNPHTQESQHGKWWDDASTQTSFRALRLIEQKGFALRRDGNMTFIDFDDCLTAKGKLIKNLKPGAKWILEHLPKTFIEVSVRGRGLHAVLWGTLPKQITAKELEGFEAYSCERFMATTGVADNGSVLTLANGQPLLNEIWEKYGDKTVEKDPAEKPKWNGTMIWLDVENYLQHYGLTYSLKHDAERDVYQFEECPMCKTHSVKNGQHFLYQYPSGKMAFHCFHAQCDEVGWGEFKTEYPPAGFWMNKTEEGESIPLAPSDPIPANYMTALHAMGYTFSINEMNDRPYANNILVSKSLESFLITRLRNVGYKKKDWFTDAMLAEGHENRSGLTQGSCEQLVNAVAGGDSRRVAHV